MLMKEFFTTTLYLDEISSLPSRLEQWQGNDNCATIENVSVIRDNLILIIASKIIIPTDEVWDCNHIDQRIVGNKV